uniref:Uncharacterized protein n=1 Tax=Globodera rostochiensis TaxID=31243 RepID=A0A914GVB0_GLORO
MISLIAFAIVMLSVAEGLKCGVKYDVGGKFSQDTLDEFDCVVDGHKCVYAESKTTSNSTTKLPDFPTSYFAATSETTTNAESSAFLRENFFCGFLILFIVIELLL